MEIIRQLDLSQIIRTALAEDVGQGDITTAAAVPIDRAGRGRITVKERCEIIFCGGFTGFMTAILLEFIPSSFLYPLIVHGKPVNFFTVPAFFPIMFELTILLSAFTAFFGVFVLNRLPRFHHPLFGYRPFRRVTRDAFFIVIEAVDPRFSDAGTVEFLAEIGGKEAALVYEDD